MDTSSGASIAPSITAMESLSINSSLSKIDINDTETVGQWAHREAFDYPSLTATRDAELPRSQPYGDWLASAERYEWKDDYGDVAPRNEALERMLFGLDDDEPCGAGIDFSRLFILKVQIDGTTKPNPILEFAEAGLHPVMLENIALSKYTRPTPIQRYCIPAILSGYDLLSCAQTGSGKTAAFLIPILSKLMGKAKKFAAPRPKRGENVSYIAEPLVLVISPTRELATQIFDECRRFCYRSMLRPCVIYGGADSMTQRIELGKGCDVLVGTPGRTIDFLEKGSVLSLKRLKYIVVDEADEMLDMGFEPQIRKLLQASDCNQDDDKQVMMFSATFQKPIRQLAAQFLSDDYIQIKVGRIGSTPDNITQHVIWVDEDKKKQALFDLLCTAPPARTMIFVNHKRTADSIDDYLYNHKLPCTSIHGDRTQREREDALIAFRSGKCPILIATGIAARGLDIKNVMHIVNYDMVANIDEYIHRIGRTARIGNHGLATSFYNDRNSSIAPDLVKILMENNQDVPDFLEEYKPTGELNFDENDDSEELPFTAGAAADGGAWGTEGAGQDQDLSW
ncbi:P-loop containing nucleoside triphosphate hydrolase protein [Tricharina praecox]|uniref:P-loop containing nucleoside triphosphate hydrolase protein n=1 Tax=Tricharina praecox TaxID=43433 RepID=UPI00221F7F5D|nr:P-loop containing nucleoside triphosphate hydrolase protein [Tricharina praecox]KAI5845510.1 P-loop containing nucleoside triphosphate hydrolase protein [Tricharina praecox]